MTDPKYLRPGIPFALAHVVEECGEVLAAAGKCQRWGLDSVNPELPADQQETNCAWLLRELDDLEGTIHRLRATIRGDVRGTLPADVRRLIIAARIVAFEDQSVEALRELDQASEAFADRVPWDDEPEEGEA